MSSPLSVPLLRARALRKKTLTDTEQKISVLCLLCITLSFNILIALLQVCAVCLRFFSVLTATSLALIVLVCLGHKYCGTRQTVRFLPP
jgi:hypothetical protein